MGIEKSWGVGEITPLFVVDVVVAVLARKDVGENPPAAKSLGIGSLGPIGFGKT